MFTGIIEAKGEIVDIINSGSNKTFTIRSTLAGELKPDQSLAHNGVCLTVEGVSANEYRVTAIDETLKKTNLGQWQIGDKVNLERCLRFEGRIDGHIVQGHVDTIAVCNGISEKDGSTEFSFEFDPQYAALIIEKGSITVNGISLTCFNVSSHSFMVAIIPYTLEHTNMNALKLRDLVNLEFDMIGKYVNRINQIKRG